MDGNFLKNKNSREEEKNKIENSKENYAICMHIADAKKLWEVTASLKSSSVLSHGDYGGSLKSFIEDSNDRELAEQNLHDRHERINRLLEEVEDLATGGVGYEALINNAEKRFKEKNTNIYFIRPEDAQS